MFVYRIVKKKIRTKDLSGKGAYNEGGRWNNEGVFALYTSENEALALLEVLVHAEESELPPDLYITTIELPNSVLILTIADSNLPEDWRIPENILLKEMGDKIFSEKKYLGIKARSAVLPGSYNFILNPLFPGYHDIVRVADVRLLEMDKRFKPFDME
jgi:RES domain-containing protein